ncbi:MAG: PEP-CTERM sorting domain-containing protein [Armatimonadetes bacterium]|nr:PEP-CTERM sorting domain-containing protein [Armatimonadota bacterium]
MRRYILILALAVPLTAAAQFFDHFEGDRLAGHWRFTSWGQSWEHSVSDSMLHVTRVFGQAEIHGVHILAELPALANFDAVSIMGWDSGSVGRGMGLTIWNGANLNRDIATIGYREPRNADPVVIVSFNNTRDGYIEVPAPPPGMHEFRLSRTGTTLEAFLNGELLLRSTDSDMLSGNWVGLVFGARDPAVFNPLHVDLVDVVPEPTTLMVLAAGALYLLRRRRP